MLWQALRSRDRDEGGAVAVTAAILLTMLVTLTAFVVDIGLLRMDEREDQLAADMAASAAFLPADAFNPFAPGAGHDACENAWDYLVANVADLDASAAVEDPSGLPPCSAFGTSDICDAATPVPVTSRIVSDPYIVEITTPVLDEGAGDATSDDLMQRNDSSSGEPCERIGVRVIRDRNYFLAGVAGFTDGATRPSAVSRFIPGEDDNFASLIVLEQFDCHAIHVTGQGGIAVENFSGPPDVPGEITVDSDGLGSCGPNDYTLDVEGMTNGYVYAEGAINLKALEVGNTAKAYETSDLTAANADSPGGVKLAVTPIAGDRELREPVDHPLNCLDDYYLGAGPWEPQHGTGELVPKCEGTDKEYTITGPPTSTVNRPPFVSRMHERLQTVDDADSDWTVFPDDFGGSESCQAAEEEIDGGDTMNDDGVTPIIDATTGTPRSVGDYLFINCPATNGPSTFTPLDVEITNVKFVVMDNRIGLGSSDSLVIDGDDSAGTVVFLQDGDIRKVAAAVLTLTDTFVYISSLSNGAIDLGAQSIPLTWRGPLTDPATRAALKAACDTYVLANPEGTPPPMDVTGVPPAGCFGPATLWSNGTSEHKMGGQAALNVAGTFFTPNAAPFNFNGDGNQNLTEAQFFSRFLQLSGQGEITLRPNPETNFETSSPSTGLIR